MASDSELVERLRGLLRTSDLDTTTTTTLRRRLEEELGVSLSKKKPFIREQVEILLRDEHARQFEEEDRKAKLKSEESDGFVFKAGNDKLDEGPVEEDGHVDEEEEAEEEEEEEQEEGDGEGVDGSDERGVGRKKRSDKPNDVVKKRGGFTKLCCLSPLLQEVTGVSEMARTEVVKKLWSYIRENNLQDPSNRRNIICDKTLHPLFKVDTIDMFQMNKALSKHIWPLEEDAPTKSATKVKQQKREREDSDDVPKQKKKQQKAGNSGFLAPRQLSDALVKFIGTGESALARSDVVKRIWDYIKQKNLQDPSDRRTILCDERLKELFDVDSFHGFTVSKLLATHFIKGEQ